MTNVVATYLQVFAASPASQGLTSLEVLRALLRREGLRGLGAGAGARILSIAPGCAISWVTYETTKQWLDGKAAVR